MLKGHAIEHRRMAFSAGSFEITKSYLIPESPYLKGKEYKVTVAKINK